MVSRVLGILSTEDFVVLVYVLLSLELSFVDTLKTRSDQTSSVNFHTSQSPLSHIVGDATAERNQHTVCTFAVA